MNITIGTNSRWTRSHSHVATVGLGVALAAALLLGTALALDRTVGKETAPTARTPRTESVQPAFPTMADAADAAAAMAPASGLGVLDAGRVAAPELPLVQEQSHPAFAFQPAGESVVPSPITADFPFVQEQSHPGFAFEAAITAAAGLNPAAYPLVQEQSHPAAAFAAPLFEATADGYEHGLSELPYMSPHSVEQAVEFASMMDAWEAAVVAGVW